MRSFQRIHRLKIKGKLGSKNDKEDKEDVFVMHIHIMLGLPKSPPTIFCSINLHVFKPNPLKPTLLKKNRAKTKTRTKNKDKDK